MQFEKRKSGISRISGLPWGSRFCLFHQTSDDLLEILVSYFKAGLENNESCLWVTSEPLDAKSARRALAAAVPNLEKYEKKGQVEIIPRDRWRARGGRWDRAVVSRLDKAIHGGFDGLRLACEPFPEKPGAGAVSYAETLSRYNVIAAFTYPRDESDTIRLMEVVKNHRFALVRNAGSWEVIESSEARTAKDALKRSEEKLKTLFSNMSEGFAYHRMVLDGRGVPCDYVFLEVNEAFERLTGLKRRRVLGKRATQVLHGIETDPADWIGRYGRVALSGKPARFESYSESLKKWHSVSAFSPHKGYFALTFSDITERIRAEEALKESERRVRLKLESILSPEGDIGTLELADIIDAPAIQSLLEDFHSLSGIPVGILDTEGRVLVGVGWQDICTKFHRVNPESCGHCTESDTELSAGVAAGEFRLYRCKNSMWDIATPIMVGGKHVGNIFMGQFFFEGEDIDYGLFRSQARRYGFDEQEYIAALDAVPRFSRRAVDTAMSFYMKLAQMLSQLSYGNIKLARSLAEQNALTDSLREGREDLNRAQAVARTGSWRLNVRRNELLWSDQTYAMFGIPKGTPLTYEAFLGAVYPDDRGFVDSSWQAALTGGTYDIEHRIVESDSVKWVRERAELEFDEKGRLLGGFGTVQDVTERRRTEEQIRKLNRELERRVEELTAANNELESFSYSVSHDLRAPLRHIQGYVELLLKNTGETLDEKGLRYLNTISSSSSQMGELIDSLLAFSRMGRAEMSRTRVNMEKFVRDVIRALEEDAKGRDVSWEVGSMPAVYCDPSMLRLAITNLVLNALKFTRGKDRAVIEVGSRAGKDGETVFFVRDNGAGFDMQYAGKLFGVFQRLHRVEEFEGNGIGLASVRRIITRHGGRIWAEGAPGEGATFYFTLPTKESA